MEIWFGGPVERGQNLPPNWAERAVCGRWHLWGRSTYSKINHISMVYLSPFESQNNTTTFQWQWLLAKSKFLRLMCANNYLQFCQLWKWHFISLPFCWSIPKNLISLFYLHSLKSIRHSTILSFWLKICLLFFDWNGQCCQIWKMVPRYCILPVFFIKRQNWSITIKYP